LIGKTLIIDDRFFNITSWYVARLLVEINFILGLYVSVDFVLGVENVPILLIIRTSHLDAQGTMPMAMCTRTVTRFSSKMFGRRRRSQMKLVVGSLNLWI